jgi:hypothetical protein
MDPSLSVLPPRVAQSYRSVPVELDPTSYRVDFKTSFGKRSESRGIGVARRKTAENKGSSLKWLTRDRAYLSWKAKGTIQISKGTDI